MRRTWGAGTATAAVIVLALSGCGNAGDGDGGEPGDAVSSTAAEAPVPEGTWSRVATTAEPEALGLEPALASEMLGADGELPVDLEVAGDEWKIYVTSDAGKRELGDFGTWSAGDDGRWTTVSESPGCRGCEATYLVTLDGDRLTTEIDDGDAPAADAHLVTEGSWERQS
jgi:hypothetical protein